MKRHAPLRIMTYNVRFNNPLDGEHAWPRRKDRVASLIRCHQPDVVGVQEALKEQVDDLAAPLEGYAWFGTGRDGGDRGEFCAIFYRQQRLHLDKGSTFWLSETPDVAACKGWDADCPRIVTWGKFKDVMSERSYYHFNTHIDHRGLVARRESVKQLIASVQALAQDAPAGITGDFNFIEAFASYELLRQAFLDAYYASEAEHEGPVGTFHGFEVSAAPGIRIDYVFVTPEVKVLRYATLSDSQEGFYPSDHLPVLIEVVP
jgi:endonuclease/exonuclease/phosphatase family metal-dependent hydrolase